MESGSTNPGKRLEAFFDTISGRVTLLGLIVGFFAALLGVGFIVATMS